ncbi:MAG: methylated-DNA--[protein]-cysteine S-methyltransferase [Actinomycetaceae bacterium]|nr:methylated-DNA--[protein]-cysteine S-methyltransferase [Actinomycetaceae bacterium]
MADAASAFPVAPADMVWLRTRLAAEAQESGMLDVGYRTIETPVGELLIASTEKGVVRVAFEAEDFEAVLQSLARRISSRVLEAPGRLDAVARQLDEYFAGRRQTFDVPLDWRLSSGFRTTVQMYLPSIEYGTTRSYKDVAEAVGNPRAVRAVGTACASNPLPVIIPCHRVVRSDGGLGGYIGGLEAKVSLLDLEKTSRGAVV